MPDSIRVNVRILEEAGILIVGAVPPAALVVGAEVRLFVVLLFIVLFFEILLVDHITNFSGLDMW